MENRDRTQGQGGSPGQQGGTQGPGSNPNQGGRQGQGGNPNQGGRTDRKPGSGVVTDDDDDIGSTPRKNREDESGRTGQGGTPSQRQVQPSDDETPKTA
jgi:hypothetical protein